MHVILINIISILSFVGFSISLYIYGKKKSKKKLICPRQSNCETVIHSDYSTILCIPVEVLGMIYYAFIGIMYPLVFILQLWSPQIAIILLAVSGASVVFSIYLVSIQAFVVRHWCIWCLSSALTSVLIFAVSYWHLHLYFY